jgi:uncharacterized repeat protein (TIGR03803 family)
MLHHFGPNGSQPYDGLIFDASGNLYGTTAGGNGPGCKGTCGTVFELTPNASGGWTDKVLHSFSGEDWDYPYAGLIFDAAGNLYGTTIHGGIGAGTVFELTPAAGGSWTEKVVYNFSGGQDGGYPYGGLIFDASGDIYGTTYIAAVLTATVRCSS